MHFNRGNLTSLKNLVLWQRPWLKKSTTTEPQKLPTLFSYISLPKCFIASEVFVEQAIHLQKLCLSPSHYETACIAGRISRQVRRFLGIGRRHVKIGSTSVPSRLHLLLQVAARQESTLGTKSRQLCRLSMWKISSIESRSHPDTRYKEVILSCHFQFKFPTLWNVFCVKFLISRARVMIKCPGEGMLKLWI